MFLSLRDLSGNNRRHPPMQKQLLRTYLRILIPAVMGFITGFVNNRFQITAVFNERPGEVLVVSLLNLSLVFAVGVPILIRTLFAHRQKEKKSVSTADFILFERNLIRTALVVPYLSLVAYLYGFPEFYLAGSFLAALYAVYYFFPSQRRIAFEKRIFRVQED